MGMKEDTDEVTTKTRILSLELLQVICVSCLMVLHNQLYVRCIMYDTVEQGWLPILSFI